MGMGRDVLRRKALSGPLLAVLIALCSVNADAAALTSSDAASTARGDTAAVGAGDEPLPPAQGHEGSEVFSITIPDEDIVGRYVDGLIATRRDWLQSVLDRSRRYRALIFGALAE